MFAFDFSLMTAFLKVNPINNLKMEFLMNFEKTFISPKVRKFLQDNLKDAKDKESLLLIVKFMGA